MRGRGGAGGLSCSSTSGQALWVTVRAQWGMRRIGDLCPWSSELSHIKGSASVREIPPGQQSTNFFCKELNDVFLLCAPKAASQLLKSAIVATKQQRWYKAMGVAVSVKPDKD